MSGTQLALNDRCIPDKGSVSRCGLYFVIIIDHYLHKAGHPVVLCYDVAITANNEAVDLHHIEHSHNLTKGVVFVQVILGISDTLSDDVCC